MDAMKVIKDLTIQMDVLGEEKVATALKSIADATGSTAVTFDRTVRSVLSVNQQYERLARSIDPVFRAQERIAAGQRTLDKALAQGVIDANRYSEALDLLRTKYGTLGPANSNLSHQTANIAAQFQDIGVQLASGQSPFLIALQQGTQLSGALGDKGLKGAVLALAGGFLSLVNPVSIATIATIALGGAAFQYLTSASEEVETLDDKLERHVDIIESLKPAYGEALKGLEEYQTRSREMLSAQLAIDQQKLTETIKTQTEDLLRATTNTRMQFTDDLGFGYGNEIVEAKSKYREFADAIEHLRQSAAKGAPDIKTFREEVAAVVNSTNSPGVRAIGDELFKASEDAAKAEAALEQAAKAIQLVSGAAGRGLGDIKAFDEALGSLGKIGLPSLTDQQKALEEFRKAMASAGGFEDRQAALQAYDATLSRIGDREREKSAEETRREAERAAKRGERLDEYERTARHIEDQNQSLEIQAATFGMATGEAEKYRVQQELIVAAQQAQRQFTPELTAEIMRLAESAGVTAERMEALHTQTQTLGEFQGMGKDAFKGFVSDLMHGKSAADALTNALSRLLDKLIDLMIEGIWDPSKGGIWKMLANPGEMLKAMMPGAGANVQAGAPVLMNASSGGYNSGGWGGDPYAGPIVHQSATAAAQAASASTSDLMKGLVGGIGNMGVLTASPAIRANMEALTRQIAQEYGINPDTMAAVVKGESGFNPYALGDGGKSFGIAQLYTGGGLGNVAMERGIPLDALGAEQQLRFMAEQAKVNGWTPWHAARDNGISPWEGIPRNDQPQAFLGQAGNDNLVGSTGQLSTNFDQLAQTTSQLSPNLQQFGTDFQSMSQALQSNVPQIGHGLSQLGNVTDQGGNLVGGALQNTAGVIGQGATGVGGALNQLGQALSGMSGGGDGGFLGVLFKGIGSLFGGFSGFDWSGFGVDSLGGWSGGFAVSHSGGAVGRATTFRNVDPAIFNGVARYHEGLRPDEVPTILQKGEWVLSKQDVAGIKDAGRSGEWLSAGDRTSNAHNTANRNGRANDNGPRVTVINNGPTQAHAEEKEDGSIEVIVDALEGRLADRAARGRGKLYRANSGVLNRKNLRG